MSAKLFTREEIESYRSRIVGTTPFSGGVVPEAARQAKALLDEWHVRNLATLDAREELLREAVKVLRLMSRSLGHEGANPTADKIESALAGGEGKL